MMKTITNTLVISALLAVSVGANSQQALNSTRSAQVGAEKPELEPVSFAGVPEDVLPDIEDQLIINQTIFMSYFAKHTQGMSEDEKLDFGFELSDILLASNTDFEDAREYLSQFESDYSVDMSTLAQIIDVNQEIFEQEDAIREARIAELDAKGAELDARGAELDARGAELDRQLKLIDELLESLSKGK